MCSKCFVDVILSSLLFFFVLFILEDLRGHPVCSAAVEGGGRMYPISINLRAESDLRASVCAHACLSINETLCDGGAGAG